MMLRLLIVSREAVTRSPKLGQRYGNGGYMVNEGIGGNLVVFEKHGRQHLKNILKILFWGDVLLFIYVKCYVLIISSR